MLEAQASEVHFVVDQTLEERQVQVVPLGKLVHSGVWSKLQGKIWFKLQHGRDLETWYLEDGRHLGASEADTEVGVL